MIVYVDNEYKCHGTNDGTMREIESEFFDNKCTEFIEGYKYDDSLGYVQIFPWKSYDKLYTAQLEYEIAQYESALAEIETALGV